MRNPLTAAQWRGLGLALAIGFAGGLLFSWLGWPLPWMMGPMIATTLAALTRLPVAVPVTLRDPMMAIIGVLLGSGFTPELVANLWTWLPTLLVLPIYVALVAVSSMTYLRLVTRFDPRTTFFAGMPGGFGEMVLLGDRAGGDARRIALVHTVRVLLIVLTVPLLVRAFGIELPSALPAAARAGWLEVAGLLLAAGIGGWLGTMLRLPAPTLLGGMVVSAIGHLTGLLEGAPPVLFVAIAQLVIGCSIGARFVGFRLHDVLATMIAGIGLTLVMFAASFVVAALVHLATGTEPLLLLLALVPGGVAEMSVIALALGVDPAFVATHHIVRIAIVVMTAPF
ncbi:MAG: AbrB family transcriptional regulator, partial [Geminicoccaceae bacterium]